MMKETFKPQERYEIDPYLHRTEDGHAGSSTPVDPRLLAITLGRVAVNHSIEYEDIYTHNTMYFRNPFWLTSENMDDLEGYYDFLRQHYGIPEDASVFPKAPDDEPPTDPSSEVQP